MLIYFDIETIPTQSQEVIDAIAKDAEAEKLSVKAPSNYKSPDKIGEYLAAKRAEIDAGVAERIHATGLNGLYGSIACICFAFDDGDIFDVDLNRCGGEEAMIKEFYSAINQRLAVQHHTGVGYSAATFVGHNIASFDLQFLKHRSVILDVRPCPPVMKAMRAKPWDECIADTMLMWSSDRSKYVSMDKLCRALGIPGKGDFDGSMVAETWPVNPGKVISYCREDVERTRQIYKRLTFQGVAQ